MSGPADFNLAKYFVGCTSANPGGIRDGEGEISGVGTDGGARVDGAVVGLLEDRRFLSRVVQTDKFGAYRFTNIPNDYIYTVIALDAKYQKNAVISDKLTAGVMP